MIIVYLLKIVRFPKTCRKEYETVVPCSLYAGFTMVLMISGSYYYDYIPGFGKTVWGGALVYLTSMIVGFVLLNFLMMALKTERIN